jgi:hypothetical protein
MFGSRFAQRTARAAAGKARMLSTTARAAARTTVLVASAAVASTGVGYMLYKYQYDSQEVCSVEFADFLIMHILDTCCSGRFESAAGNLARGDLDPAKQVKFSYDSL